jgi:hypothetical protein
VRKAALLLGILAVACRGPDPSVVVKQVHRPKPVAEVVPAPVHVPFGPRAFPNFNDRGFANEIGQIQRAVMIAYARELERACRNLGDGLDETILAPGASIESVSQVGQETATEGPARGEIRTTLPVFLSVFQRIDVCEWRLLNQGESNLQTATWNVLLTIRGPTPRGAIRQDMAYPTLTLQRLETGWRIKGMQLADWPAPVWLPRDDVTATQATDLALDSTQALNLVDQLTRRERLDREFVLVQLTSTACEPCGREEFQAGLLAWRMPERIQIVGVMTSPDDDARAIEGYGQKWHVTHRILPYEPKLLAAIERAMNQKPLGPFSILLERRTGRILWAQQAPPTRSDLARLLP